MNFRRPVRFATAFSGSLDGISISGPGKSSESLSDWDHEESWRDLDNFYRENERLINECIERDMEKAARDDKFGEAFLTMDEFVSTADIVLDGLVALGNVHPILGIAIYAFHSIVRLDLARRDNDKKVMAVKLQMQYMMSSMFQFRKLKHAHVVATSKAQETAALERLVKVIVDDIKRCGNDLTYYQDRKRLAKLMNSKFYEKRFAEHIQTFTQRRSELLLHLSAYTAAGIDHANVVLANVQEDVRTIKANFAELLRKLDTPLDRDLIKFIDKNGGADACIQNETIFKDLLSRTGEKVGGDGQRKNLSEQENQGALEKIRKELKQEVSNVEDSLNKHFSRFEGLLDVQNNNLARISDRMEEHGYLMRDHDSKLDNIYSASVMILEQGKLIRKAVLPNSSIAKVKDPELKHIWDIMGAKTSVKAKVFVSTLRDHLLNENSVPGTPRAETITTGSGSGSFITDEPSSFSSNDLRSPIDRKIVDEKDFWVFDFINVAHVQPIVEAMDEDCSGFISIKEANKFALSRPKGWSLLQWMAYWATGWHISLSSYKDKIYSTIRKMHEVRDSVLSANCAYIDAYLDDYHMRAIEGILRSIKPLPQGSSKEPKLMELVDSMTKLQEERLSKDLGALSYAIQSSADVLVIAGPERAETWILPLLYIVLQHHLKIIRLAKDHIIHEDEMPLHSITIFYTLQIFIERMGTLEEIFRHIHRDAEAHFGVHAHGMFLEEFKDTSGWPSKTILLKSVEILPQHSDSQLKLEPKLSPSILNKGLPPDTFSVEQRIPAEPEAHSSHAVEGVWTGICVYYESGHPFVYAGCLQVHIGPPEERAFSGMGYYAGGRIEVTGKIVELSEQESGAQQSTSLIDVTLTFKFSFGSVTCSGKLCEETRSMRGTWSIEPDPTEDTKPEGSQEGSVEDDSTEENSRPSFFYMTKSSPHIIRFRPLLDTPDTSMYNDKPSPNLARRRWAYAYSIISFEVRERLKPYSFIKERRIERQKWIKINSRYVYYTSFSFDDRVSFSRLNWLILPSNSTIYDAMADYLHSRMVFWRGYYSCDACGRRIIFTRFICITCIYDNFTNEIDLCAECITSKAKETNFIHRPSHSLIKTTSYFHHHKFPIVIPQAREKSERIKSSFRKLEKIQTEKTQPEARTRAPEIKKERGVKLEETNAVVKLQASAHNLFCTCCKEEISLPCWACVGCVHDTLICVDCEKQNKAITDPKGISEEHMSDHILLRIMDSSEVKAKEIKTDHQLENMEHNMNERFSSLESKVSARLQQLDEVTGDESTETENQTEVRLKAVEEKVDKMDTQINRLLEMMEKVVQSVARQEGNSI